MKSVSSKACEVGHVQSCMTGCVNTKRRLKRLGSTRHNSHVRNGAH
jgi:hypothetical protein